jgi:hypothetical protein
MNCIEQVVTDNYTAIHGDCVEVLQGPAGCVHRLFDLLAAVRSLYTYSNSPRDMGNVRNDAEFFEHFDYLIAAAAPRDDAGPRRVVSLHGHAGQQGARRLHRLEGLSGEPAARLREARLHLPLRR